MTTVTIGKPVEVTTITETGEFVKMLRIPYTIEGMGTYSLEVPKIGMTAKKIAESIKKEAQEIANAAKEPIKF